MKQGTLIRGIGSFYYAVDETGEIYTLRCKKKFRHARITPLVGDEIMFSPGEGEEHGWVEDILPRKTECLRPPVSNVSLEMIVMAPEPEPDLLLTDRLMVRARKQGIRLALIVTKCDLDGGALVRRIREQYAGADAAILAVSSATGEGMDALRQLMQNELVCLAGQSGVGKSTLLNTLLGLQLETGDISEKIRRGKNTTRHAELLMKDGLRVLDTAGFSLLDLDGKTEEPITLKENWPEFYDYEGNCRFEPCYHDREPGCAVTAACAEGMINRQRLERYRTLLADARQAWRDRYD